LFDFRRKINSKLRESKNVREHQRISSSVSASMEVLAGILTKICPLLKYIKYF